MSNLQPALSRSNSYFFRESLALFLPYLLWESFLFGYSPWQALLLVPSALAQIQKDHLGFQANQNRTNTGRHPIDTQSDPAASTRRDWNCNRGSGNCRVR